MKSVFQTPVSGGTAIELLEKRLLYSTVYFANAAAKSGGNGTAQLPWNQLSSISNHGFSSGDLVSITGNFKNQVLTLGTSATGITIYSNNGTGAISETSISSAQTAITISGSTISIQGLNLTSNYSGNASVSGISFKGASTAFTNDKVSDCRASGFSYGLSMTGVSQGFANTTIQNSTFSSNTISGIETFAGTSPAFGKIYTNLVINGCTASNNPGTLASHSDCGGIFLEGVNGGTVEHCTTFDNCGGTYGAVGLWAYQSTRLNFEYDQSSDTQSQEADADGDGFDFDWGVSDSIMQYDYSHDNQGAGYLICTFNGGGGNGSNQNNTIRYCISDHDGQNINNSYGGISLSSDSTDPNLTLSGANIYDNTILMGSPGGSAICMFGNGVSPAAEVDSMQVSFLNNIFYTTNADNLILYGGSGASSKALFEGNDYSGTSAAGLDFNVNWAGAIYGTLSSWQAGTGQEARGGLVADAGLNFPVGIAYANRVSGLPISNLDELELKPTSPLLGIGNNLSASPFSNAAPYTNNAPYNLGGTAWGGLGMQDFFGDPLVSSSRKDIGANQATLPAGTLTIRSTGTGSSTVVVNSSTTDTVQFWLPIQYTLDIASGSEAIIVDDSNGNALGSAGMNFCGSSGYASTLTMIGSTGNDLFTSSSNSLTFDSDPIDYANIGFTYLNPNGGSDSLGISSGTLILSADASGGTIVPRTFSSLSIAAGSQLFVQPPPIHSERQVLIVPANVNLSGRVDLTSNDMIINGGNWGGVQANVDDGRYLTSSTTALTTSAGVAATTLGVVPNNGGSGTTPVRSSFDGQLVAYSAILIKWTFDGDANDSGTVTVSGAGKTNDGLLFNAGFNQRATGWFNGDFNHNGIVDNIDDLALFQAGYNEQGTTQL